MATRILYVLFLCFCTASMVAAQSGQALYDQGVKEKDNNRKVDLFTRALAAGKTDNWTYYQRGWAYYYLKRYELATKDLETALAAKTGDLDVSYVYSALAWCHYDQKQDTKAREWVDKAISAKKENFGAWSLSGWLYVRKKDYASALTAFNQYVTLNPKAVFGYRDRSYVLFQLGRFEECIRDCDAGLKIEPNDNALIDRKAMALLKLNRITEAIPSLAGRVQYKENDPISLTNLGIFLMDAQEYKAAIEFHNKAIQLYEKKVAEDPKFIREYRDDIYNIYLTRGDCYYYLHDYPRALQDYTRASHLKPEDYEGWFFIGEVQTFQKNYKEAIAGYEKAFSLKPGHDDGWVNLGFCYAQTGDRRKAIDAYTRGIQADPDNGLLWNNRGYSYLELKEFDKALADLKKAVETEPGIVMSHVSLAEYYYYTKDYPKAIELFNDALKMKDANTEEKVAGLFTRGLAYKELKKYDEAIRDFRETLKVNPDHARSYEQMGICQYNKKEMCEAYKNLKKALEVESRTGRHECKDAATYLGKLTQNPCAGH